MNKCPSPACSNGSYAKCGQMSKKVPDANHVSLRAETRDCKNRQGHVPTVSTSVTPRSHQRRWSADFCKCGTSPIITVKKSKKEPQPPQRGVSKRYSCPPIGVFSSPCSSSSSSSSTTSSCSSPPPVQTSVITGHDPLGWKLRPKSGSPRARTNRLSLQIPLPVIVHEPTNSQSVNDPSPKTKPLLRPKPSCRRHSDSSAFLRSLANPLPTVTLEELRAVHLRPLTLLDESDDVFGEEEVKVMARPRKTPPPVPEKTSKARQIAQLMALSHQHCVSVTAHEEVIYTRVIKPKPKHSHKTEDPSSLNAKITALHVDTSCDRDRSTPRFPGW